MSMRRQCGTKALVTLPTRNVDSSQYRRISAFSWPEENKTVARALKTTVRQTWSPETLSPRATILKVRAFDEWFDRGSGLPALQLSGSVLNGEFVVGVSRCNATVLRGGVYQDAMGPYALLESQEHCLGNCLALRVEAEAHDKSLDLASISCFELPSDLLAQAEICHATRWYSVYFNPLGDSDGTGTGGPRGRHSLYPCA